jgi:glycosyltransferase involved in cell wall biosynthesis
MPRLAWFTPLPPTRSGIAKYSAELLPNLSHSHQIDLFVDGRPEACLAHSADSPVFEAHDFVWKHHVQPYDLIVYQLGNAPCHDYMWAYLLRYPGLVVLHDGQLHHARGRLLLQRWLPRQDDYREEFWFNHPEARKDLAELGVIGVLGASTNLWPMLRAVVVTSRRVLVHNEWLAQQIAEAHPGAAVTVVEMGVPASAPAPGARQRIRARHGIADDTVIFTAFGGITPEKRIRQAMQALTVLEGATPGACLLLAGNPVDYYDAARDAETIGVPPRVVSAGYIADEEMDDYLAASDVCLCMRWPTSRETSASWLRCLAAGRPTVSTDLVHTGDIPTLDPRTWSVLSKGATVGKDYDTATVAKPVGISIDILDEDHSLRLAIRRLGTDEKLRAVLGRNARELWQRRFQLDTMAAAYEDAIAEALNSPEPDSAVRMKLPSHLRATGIEHAKMLFEDIAGPSVNVFAPTR